MINHPTLNSATAFELLQVEVYVCITDMGIYQTVFESEAQASPDLEAVATASNSR